MKQLHRKAISLCDAQFVAVTLVSVSIDMTGSKLAFVAIILVYRYLLQ